MQELRDAVRMLAEQAQQVATEIDAVGGRVIAVQELPRPAGNSVSSSR